jgi:hypothetical protein
MTFEELWRPIETGDPDKMEFCRGGGWRMVIMGCLWIMLGILILGLLVLCSGDFWSWILDALKTSAYNLVVLIYFFGAVVTLSGTTKLLMGIWAIWGRTDVILERKDKSVTRSYRLHSFCLYRKIFTAGDSSVFLIRRKIHSFALIHFLRLKDKTGKRRWVLAIPRIFAEDGWRMAEKMAGFFEIPLVAADAK